jgi:adenylate kinase
MRQIFLFFGPPGSGKGTQSDILGYYLDMPTISTGELLRHEQKIDSSLGRKVKEMMAQGKLVSEDLVDVLLKKRLSKRDTERGFILDGYPRNEKQFTHLIKKIIKKEDQLLCINIEVSDTEVKERLTGRRVCDCGASYHLKYNPPKKEGICDLCGKKIYVRNDDKPVVVKKRLEDYHQSIKPLLEYADKLVLLIKINGEQSIEKIKKDIVKALIQKSGKK